MSFSVGDLEATLRLNRTPFVQGLEAARAEARRFEEHKITPEVDVDVHGVDEAKARLESLRERVTAHVDVDAGHAHAELDVIERELRKVDGETASAEVKVEAAHALADLAAVRHEVNALDRERVSIPVETRGAAAALAALAGVGAATRALSSHVSGMHIALGAAASGLTALAPVAAAATVGIGALGGSMVAAGAGTLLFGAAARSTFKDVGTAVKQVTAAQRHYNMQVLVYGKHSDQANLAAKRLKATYDLIPPALRPLVKVYQDLGTEWGKFQQAVRPLAIQLATTALNGVKQVLPQLLPVAQAAGRAFNELAKEASGALQGPFWQHFIHFLTRSAGPAITSFGRIIGNLMHAFAALAMAFEPQSRSMENALVRLTHRFAEWATHLSSSGGFHQFLAYVHSNMPQIVALFKSLGTTLGLVARALAAGGPSAMKLWITLLQTLNTALKAVGPHVAGFILAFAGVGLVIGKVVGPVVTMIGWLGKLGPAMSLAGTAGKLLFSALRLGAGMLLAFVAPAFSAVGAAVVALAAIIGAPVAVVVAAIAAIVAIAVLVVAKWDWVKGALGAIWGAIKDAAAAIWGAIKDVVTTVVHALATAVVATWDAIKGVTATVWNWIKGFLGAIWSGIKADVSDAIGLVKGIVTGGWNLLKDVTSSVWDWIKAHVAKAWDSLVMVTKNALHNIVDFFKGLPGRVLSILKDLGGMLLDTGKWLMEQIVKGIEAGANWVYDKLKSVVNMAKGLLPFSEPKDPSSPLRNLSASGRAIMENVALGIPAGLPAVQAALRKAAAGMRAGLDVGGGLGPMAVRAGAAAGGGSVGVSHVTYGDVNFTMPTPVAGNGTPDPAHLRALLSEELRKLGRR